MSVPRSISSLLVVAFAVLVAAGCGDDGDSSPKSDADEPVTVRQVAAPEADEDLTDELGSTATELTDAGCAFGTYELDDAEHIEEGDDLGQDHFPPTGGRHYADWAPFGLYDEPIDDGFVVHNLEHGGVVVWLGADLADGDAISDLLDEEYVDDDEKWVVAPRLDIAGLFSAAWGLGLSCPPAAVEKLGTEEMAEALDEWYSVVVSTGSEAEKDVPAYAGAMKEPTPTRDISTEAPF